MTVVSITFDESASQFIVEAFGWHFSKFDCIVDDDEIAVRSITGEIVPKGKFAGIVMWEGKPTPLLDNLIEIMALAKERETLGD